MITIRPEQPADADGIRRVNEEAFMAMPLAEGAFACQDGVVRYPPEFSGVWRGQKNPLFDSPLESNRHPRS
ncbi:MAG: hypothetical protein ACYC5X_04590 [Syntrophales bacterium]